MPRSSCCSRFRRLCFDSALLLEDGDGEGLGGDGIRASGTRTLVADFFRGDDDEGEARSDRLEVALYKLLHELPSTLFIGGVVGGMSV